MVKTGLVCIFPIHPAIGNIDIGRIIAFQGRTDDVVVIIQFHVREHHIGINLIEIVKCRFKRFKIVVVACHLDFTRRFCVQLRLKAGLFFHFRLFRSTGAK